MNCGTVKKNLKPLWEGRGGWVAYSVNYVDLMLKNKFAPGSTHSAPGSPSQEEDQLQAYPFVAIASEVRVGAVFSVCASPSFLLTAVYHVAYFVVQL